MDDPSEVFFDRNDLNVVPELHGSTRRGAEEPEQRALGGNRNSYLVDKDGVQYDANSLSWRYLGLYIDCDQVQDGNYCERKLLWAAYHDPHYRGNSIEEYKFYDMTSGEWDDSTCSRYGGWKRCARLDCHEPSTGFELVGVFKESDGMYDWTEQLFKHEGMCIWNDDEAYETMEKWMEKWPTSCQQLYVSDVWGNALYMALKPLPGGNVTVAIYKDSGCTASSNMDLTKYLVKLYQSKGYYDDTGYTAAETWKEAIATWNEKMSYFKVCQPCVAYNLFSEQSNNKKERKGRFLGGNQNNDGNGYERKRYNCYDDAGYTNVNQCYKFETKTNLKMADEDDLSTASKQGTILRIKAYDKVYGKGGYSTPMSHTVLVAYESFAVVATAGIVLSVLYLRRCFQRFVHGRRKIMPTSMNDVLCGGVDTDNAAMRARRWRQWVSKGGMKAGTSGLSAELDMIDAEVLPSVTKNMAGMYDPPLCVKRGGESCIEPSERLQILENYIELKLLGKAMADVCYATSTNLQSTARFPESVAYQDSLSTPPSITPPETSCENYIPNDMNNRDTLEDQIIPLGPTKSEYGIRAEQQIIGGVIADEINSSGSANSEISIRTEGAPKTEDDDDRPPPIDQGRTNDAPVSTVEYAFEKNPGVTNHSLSMIAEE